jgi:Icc-related predicted phosphoesterase
MKLICLSDTHNQLTKVDIPDGDVLIHAGDFSNSGNYADHYTFAKQFGAYPHKHKIVVFGNHDVYAEKQTNIIRELFKEHGITVLLDEEIIIDGFKFYGSPWVPRYGNWAWMRDRGRHIGVKFDNIPENVDVLITHGQPYGILDTTIYGNGNQGCKELLKACIDKQPKHVMGGHLHHEGGTQLTKHGMTFYNLAICDEQYSPCRPVTVIDL